MPLLSLSNVRAGYGESVVLDDLSIAIGEGEIVCLLGANGAGKTTTTRVIAGLVKAWSGDVRFDGESIVDVPAHRRVEYGICLSPEGRQMFSEMTVMENLLVGSYSKRGRPHRKQALDEALALFPRLAERRAQKAGLMSGGEQQMLAIARALMGRPRLLMLDEPSLGLAPRIIMDVYAAVAKTAKAGISILIVEQNAEAALSAAHRGYVLANGRIATEGSAAELRGSRLVQEAFLGTKPLRRAVLQSAPSVSPPTGSSHV
jgi:branched-chain amino acid transport system ATP-binding protein